MATRRKSSPDCEVDLEVRDFSAGRNGAREAGILKFFAEREQMLFDFAQPPFVRASLAKLSDTEHLLLLTFHHLVGNGPSYAIFLEEFIAAYAALAGGKDAQLRARPAIARFRGLAHRAGAEPGRVRAVLAGAIFRRPPRAGPARGSPAPGRADLPRRAPGADAG